MPLAWELLLSDGPTWYTSKATSFPSMHPALWVTFCKCTQDVSSIFPSTALNLEPLQREIGMHSASFLNLYIVLSLQTLGSLGNLSKLHGIEFWFNKGRS